MFTQSIINNGVLAALFEHFKNDVAASAAIKSATATIERYHRAANAVTINGAQLKEWLNASSFKSSVILDLNGFEWVDFINFSAFDLDGCVYDASSAKFIVDEDNEFESKEYILNEVYDGDSYGDWLYNAAEHLKQQADYYAELESKCCDINSALSLEDSDIIAGVKDDQLFETYEFNNILYVKVV